MSVASSANASAYFGDVSSFYELSVSSSPLLGILDKSYQSAHEKSFLTFLMAVHSSMNEHLE
jgi:hypothetical protein